MIKTIILKMSIPTCIKVIKMLGCIIKRNRRGFFMIIIIPKPIGIIFGIILVDFDKSIY
jgi:hypothetical protein